MPGVVSTCMLLLRRLKRMGCFNTHAFTETKMSGVVSKGMLNRRLKRMGCFNRHAFSKTKMPGVFSTGCFYGD